MCVEWEAKIPYFGGGSTSTTATASYSGKYGTENTVQDSSTVENSRTVTCPPKTRCTLKLVASKLDDYNIPFTALVERTQDVGPPLQWYENGTWKGVQAFNFNTFYCTTVPLYQHLTMGKQAQKTLKRNQNLGQRLKK